MPYIDVHSKEKQSFGLIRTNAALTGNVKLTVSSDYKITLNSIDGHPSLADIKFKSVPTDETSSYHQDLSRFFNGISPAVIFNVDTTIRNITSQDYEKQYDFRFTAGAKRSTTSYYNEQFSFFAPVHIGDSIPDAFVIYRLQGAAETGEIIGTGSRDLAGMIKNAKLVASFDLSLNTTIGRYLLKTTSSDKYAPHSFIFRKDEDLDRYFLDWTGISVSNPVIATLSEDVTYTFKTHSTILDFEQYITEGRKRMGLVDHRILNLEFMFDDVDATDYTINRYVGFYTTAQELGKVYLDGVTAYAQRDTDNNVPKLKREQGGAYSADGDFYQQNANGVRLYVNPTRGVMPSADTMWVKSKDNNYYGFKTGVKYGTSLELVMDRNSVNLGNLRGTSDKQLTVPAKRAPQNSKSFFQLALPLPMLKGPGDFDRILIEHPVGQYTCAEGFGNPTTITVVTDARYYLDLTDPNNQILWVYLDTEWVSYGKFIGRLPKRVFEVSCNNFSDTMPDTWIPGAAYYTYFNNVGSRDDVTKSICAAINNIARDFMTAVVIDTNIIVYVKSSGVYNSRRIFSTFDCGAGANTIFTFKGGAKGAIRYSTSEALASQTLDLCYVSRRGVDKINSIVLDLENTLSTGKLDKFIIDIPTEPLSATKSNLFLYEALEPSVGMFLFHEWRELDGDFLDSTYAVNEVDLLRSYFDMPDGQDILDLTKTYAVKGSGSITNGGQTVSSGYTFTPTAKSFKIVDGFPIVYENSFIDEDLSNCKGVSSLVTSPSIQEISDGGVFGKANSNIRITNPQQRTEVFDARERFTRFIASNEYDALKENYTTTHSLESRTLPWISKWVHLFGTDTRDNPYRFNASAAFGKTNLSPSFFSKTVSSEELTHEWFYIEGLGRNKSKNAWHIDDIFNLTNYTSNKDILGVNVDEFVRFFGERYAILEKSDKDCVCLFKGVEYRMPSRLEGYKFSILLQRADTTKGLPPISTSLYENVKYKNVLLLIEVSLDDYRMSVDSANRKVIDHILMYSAKSLKSSSDTVKDNYLSSALDFSNATVHNEKLIVPIINRHHSDLRNEIVDVSSITGLKADYPYGHFEIGPPLSVNETEMFFPPATLLSITEFVTGPLENTVLPFMTRSFWHDSIIEVVGGGKGLFHQTMERLSFGYFNQNIREYPEEVLSYIIKDGTVGQNSMDITTEIPSVIYKQNNPFYSDDKQKPEQFTHISKIGYTINNREEVIGIMRYAGPYVAKTRACIWFDEAGTVSEDSGLIKNMHGIKVGPSTILTELGSPSAYRLIGEFPLFAADFDVFKSTCASDFYKKYDLKDRHVSAPGISVVKEQGNMFGNILMNLPKEIYIQNFTGNEYFTEGGGTVVVIDLMACVTKQIVDTQYQLFVDAFGSDPTALISAYVEQNVMSQYTISSFDVYVKPKKELPYEFVGLSDIEKIKQGFVKSTAAKVEQEKGYVYSINVAGNFNGSYQFTTSVLLKLI